jgi:SAM-dependent methyltransferase
MEGWYDRAFGRWYPRLYPHRDWAEAVQAVESVFPWLPESGLLLDVGCGGGRHLRALRKRGRVAVGLDRSWPLLREARRLFGLEPRLVRGDMRNLPFRDRAFAGVLTMFTTFGYFGSREAHVRLLAELARVTATAGTLILDYLNALHVRENLVPDSSRIVDGHHVREQRSIVEDEEGERVIKETEIRDAGGRVVDRLREDVALYRHETLSDMLGGSGWRELAALGDYAGNPFTSRSDRLLIVAERAAR